MLKNMNLIVTVKHFTIHPETFRKFYDYDENFIFTYDMKTLGIKGSAWKKEVKPDDVADVIKSYFHGTNYDLANIQKQLD